MLEVYLNSSQYGIDKDNSSKSFLEEIGKLDLLKLITTKFKPEKFVNIGKQLERQKSLEK